MKTFTAFLLLFFSLQCCFSQNDTLLFENFQDDPSDDMLLFPNGDDTFWVNLDADGFSDFNGYPQNWFQALDFLYQPGVPVGPDTNFVFVSSSWLTNPQNLNRNWLILPPLEIVDDQAVLHWKSAPFQAPLFMDGYSVLVSTTSNDPLTGDFTDTLFRAAQNIPPWPPANSLDPADYFFSPGYVHADNLSLPEYVYYDPAAPDTIYTGLLEPHAIPLAGYANQTIYISFVHDSDDDYLLALDDILVKGTNPVSTNETYEIFDLRIGPNPVLTTLEISFYLYEKSRIRVSLTDLQGKILLEKQAVNMSVGSHWLEIDLRDFAGGAYFLTLAGENSSVTRKIFKF